MLRNLREHFILKKIRPFMYLDGWLSSAEALGLYTTAARLPRHATVVEIGSWQGRSTFCLAKGLSSGKIYAIDPFNTSGGFDTENEALYKSRKGGKDLLQSFVKNMETLKVMKKIVVKKGYSSQFHQDFSKIDLLFIDGDHSIEGCTADFELYAPKVATGGYIAFHDYHPDRPSLGPTHVVDNLVRASPAFAFYRQYDSLWIAKKIS